MRDRTADLLRARQALSQLSYSPFFKNAKTLLIEAPCCAVYQRYTSSAATKSRSVLVGLGRFELPTSPLSGVRSNQLSYRPIIPTPKRESGPACAKCKPAP